MQKLYYFNDGKGKHQSHEIDLTVNSEDTDISEIASDFQISFGSDLLEALTNHYNSAVSLRKLLDLYIDDMKTGNFCIADAVGKPISTWVRDYYGSDRSEEHSVAETIKQFTDSINNDSSNQL